MIDVFKDEEGDWVKVRYGRTIKEVPPDSPDIRIPSDNASVQPPDEWQIGSQCQLYSVEAMRWIDGEIITTFSDEHGDWLRVQCGQRIRDVLRHDAAVRMAITDSVDEKAGHFRL